MSYDARDRAILDILQADAAVAVEAVAERVALSPSQAWRRIKRLEDDGVIARRVALVDRRAVGVPTTVFVTIRAPRHSLQWLERFRALVATIPEIVEAFRLTGETDYLVRVVVPSIEAYDAIYKRLIGQLEFGNISASIAMEELKFTTAVPTCYLTGR